MNPAGVIKSIVGTGKEVVFGGARSIFNRIIFSNADDRSDRNGEDGECLTFQLIDGSGDFNSKELLEFVREVKLSECGRSYAVVAIMGPQSSGKSTLLNHLFGTSFKEMKYSEGRSQTTLGIWMAKSLHLKPLTLVMDIEGTDGAERGEDDTAFEKQSALFALAVADVVLINMWCHEIGRENAANKPLLRAVFQQVLIRFCDHPRNITLMFVIRDKTMSPEEKLEANLRKDLEKIWASIPKPSGRTNIKLTTFFKVLVEFLPNYERDQRDFKYKVKNMKRRFIDSTAPGGLVGNGKEPASGFPILAENIWNDIMLNKDLNLPNHKVMVATIRCEEISNEKYDSFEVNEEWNKLRKNAQLGFVLGFGKKVDSIVKACIAEYNEETSYFDEVVRTKKREDLVDKVLKLVEPVYRAMLNHLKLKHLKKFMEEFDRDSDKENMSSMVNALVERYLNEFEKECADVSVEQANWDAFREKAELRSDMNSYVVAKRDDKLASQIRRIFEPKLKQELSDAVGYFLCEETDPTWSKIREHFESVMKSTLLSLGDKLTEFGVDDEESRKEKLDSMENYAKDVVEAKAREESCRVKEHMLKKFVRLFQYDYDATSESPREWNKTEEIHEAAKNALYAPLDVLVGLAAIRLADDEAVDDIHDRLTSALLGSKDLMTLDYLNGPPNSGEQSTLNELDINPWAQVPSSRTLLTPAQCKQLWKEYLVGAQDAFILAMKAFQKKQNKKPRWGRILKKTFDIMNFMLQIIGINVGLAGIFSS